MAYQAAALRVVFFMHSGIKRHKHQHGSMAAHQNKSTSSKARNDIAKNEIIENRNRKAAEEHSMRRHLCGAWRAKIIMAAWRVARNLQHRRISNNGASSAKGQHQISNQRIKNGVIMAWHQAATRSEKRNGVSMRG